MHRCTPRKILLLSIQGPQIIVESLVVWHSVYANAGIRFECQTTRIATLPEYSKDKRNRSLMRVNLDRPQNLHTLA